MIFVTIGTSEPFDRLLRALPLVVGEELVVQAGESTTRPRDARCITYVPFDELVELVRAARIVVTHAGVGTIMVALANGKRPIVVPRLARFGEAVDDHQLGLARRLDKAGFVTAVEDEAELAKAIAVVQATPLGTHDGNGSLARDLLAYMSERLGTVLVPAEPR
jgi:UDP-N-acetylglucosamine transferase subunit ALG13